MYILVYTLEINERTLKAIVMCKCVCVRVASKQASNNTQLRTLYFHQRSQYMQHICVIAITTTTTTKTTTATEAMTGTVLSVYSGFSIP